MQHPGRALLGERGQLCLLSNQIVGFFDHQYLWKESSDILVFCMELVIKGRQHLRLTILGVASCASHSIRLQDSDHQYICKESTNLFDFLHLLDRCAGYIFQPIRLQDFLIINICGKNQVILVWIFTWR